jgi:hypothetical protein
MTVEPHWLTRPATIRKLWGLFIVVLAGVVLAGLLIGPEGHFAIEDLFGFNALFGVLACAALILIAKAIGILLKRPDTYYDQREHDA